MSQTTILRIVFKAKEVNWPGIVQQPVNAWQITVGLQIANNKFQNL